MTAAVFLDRDNTLIHNDGDLGDPEAVRLVKGAASAIASLRGLSYKIVVVTNQGGVARGKFTEADVLAVHDRIVELVKATSGSSIDRFYFCPYHPEGKTKKYRREHPWRKPQPGMLLQAADDLGLDLSRSWLIGDQKRDVDAAAAAGVRAILLSEDDDPAAQKATQDPDAPAPETPTPGLWVAPTIIEAVKIIAQKGRMELTASEPTAPSFNRRRHTTTENAAGGPDPRETKTVDPTDRPQGGASKPAAPRPFRPWTTQPADDEPATTTAEPAGEAANEAPSSATPQPPPAVTAARPTPAQTEPDAAVEPVGPSQAPSEQVLRQILQELRSQRGMDSEFSYHHMIAIVLQMIAAVCLLGALWMGAANLDLFVRWLGVALGVQLATIAMLLFRR